MRNINQQIIACKKCSRLNEYIKQIATQKKRKFQNDDYWGKPVPNFGDEKADLLIIGLAPAAHGANRTGQMFTGDRSGEWLFRALHRANFANQAGASSIADGLKLHRCLITAVNHCAPPQNKPTREEIIACSPWLEKTFSQFSGNAILCLGRISWTETLRLLKRKNLIFENQKLKFSHSAHFSLKNELALFGSYHPSQQNTFTGKLTAPMFDEIFLKINRYLEQHSRPDE